MYEVDHLYQIDVAGHGKQVAVFLGRSHADELRPGDFLKVGFMGGMAALTVSVKDIRREREQWLVDIDWSGFRDNLPGASLLPEEIEISDKSQLFSDVWRLPVCDYCDQAAVSIQRDGDDVLCRACGEDQYDNPSESLTALTPARFNRLWG